MTKETSDTPLIPAKPSPDDRLEIVKILILMVGSFAVGFALVILFLRPTAPGGDEPLVAVTPAAAPASETAPAAAEEPAEPAEEAPAEEEDGPSAAAAIDEGEAPPTVPPGRTPEGVALEGDPFYLKCWDADGNEQPGASCDRLTVLEKRFSTRLYVVDACKKKHAEDDATGKLSLGVEVDFPNRTLSFWNGASSDIENAAAIGTCLRTELAGLPMDSVDHKNERYRIFFSVRFGAAKDAPKPAPAAPSAPSTTDAPPPGKGRLVDVVLDRVRVRKEPVDGDPIGKISSGNKVRLLKKKGKWCNIVTPNENEGWMICEALDL